MTFRHNELGRNAMQRINRGIDTTGAGTVRHLCIAGLFSLLFLLATVTYAQGACTDCHYPGGMGPLPHNVGCTDTSCAQACHPKDLNRLNHPGGQDSPLSGDRTTTCRNCHNKPFPGVYHPYKINTSAGSITPPGTVDLNDACGQCHGGGDNSMSNPPPEPNAPYLNKMQLGTHANGIHYDRPNASASYSVPPNSQVLNVDASGSTCINVCDAYDWDWGDGTPHASGVTASHTYAPGTYVFTLTVTDNGVGTGTFSRQITVYAPDSPPTVNGTACANILNPNTWIANITDSSTDDIGIKQVTVNWGDGSGISSDTTLPFGPFSRTYSNAGTYTITHKAIDTIGQSNTRTCTATPAYFTISGTVRRSVAGGGAVVPSATVTVKQGTTLVRTVYTASNGTFSIGTLKPGTYTLTVTKSGYTFTVPAATITVGPSNAGNVINALTP